MTADHSSLIGAALREIHVAFAARWVALLGTDAHGRTAIIARGGEPPTPLPALVDDSSAGPSSDSTILIEHLAIHPYHRAALVLTAERAWTKAETERARLAAALVRVMWEHDPAHDSDRAGLDRLTGLPNHAYFLEEADRHIERLIQERAPGTLMLVETGDLDPIALAHGAPTRDQVLIRIGTVIRAMVRPADIVGRMGPDSFAVWLDGVDHMTAAERAETLCARRLTLSEAPNRSTVAIPPLSVGIASRRADSEEDAREVLLRAREAVAQVRRTEGGGWQVSHAS
jgi:diguanylate cyclase (GGDEF)-like protein